MGVAQGAVAQLQSNGDYMKLARVVRFHVGNGVRCAERVPLRLENIGLRMKMCALQSLCRSTV